MKRLLFISTCFLFIIPTLVFGQFKGLTYGGKVLEYGGKIAGAEEYTPIDTLVYYVSTSGSDANSGLATDAAWKTPNYADSNIVTGGSPVIVALQPGDTFAGLLAMEIKNSGTAEYPVIWDGNYYLWGGGADAIVQTSGDRSDGNVALCAITGCDYVTIQNIDFDGNDMKCFGIVVGGGTDNVYSPNAVQDDETNIIIQDCNIHDVGDASDSYQIAVLVQTWNNDQSDITFRRNTVNGATNHCVSFYPGRQAIGATPATQHNSYIGYNTVTNFGLRGDGVGSGIQVVLDNRDAIIEHNTVTQGTGTQAAGITTSASGSAVDSVPTGMIIRYNDVRMTDRAAYLIQNGNAITGDIYYNVFYCSACANGSADPVMIEVAAYPGSDLNFYNNVIVSEGTGAAMNHDGQTAGMVDLKNNILLTTNADANAACLVATTSANFTHSYNAYMRTAGEGDPNYVLDDSWYTRSTVGAWEATGVIDPVPLFTNPSSNWNLQTASPCLDAGVNIPSIPQFDINGTAVPDPPNMGVSETIEDP